MESRSRPPLSNKMKSSHLMTLILSFLSSYKQSKALLYLLSKSGQQFFNENHEQLKLFCGKEPPGRSFKVDRYHILFISDNVEEIEKLTVIGMETLTKTIKYFPNLKRVKRLYLEIIAGQEGKQSRSTQLFRRFKEFLRKVEILELKLPWNFFNNQYLFGKLEGEVHFKDLRLIQKLPVSPGQVQHMMNSSIVDSLHMNFQTEEFPFELLEGKAIKQLARFDGLACTQQAFFESLDSKIIQPFLLQVCQGLKALKVTECEDRFRREINAYPELPQLEKLEVSIQSLKDDLFQKFHLLQELTVLCYYLELEFDEVEMRKLRKFKLKFPLKNTRNSFKVKKNVDIGQFLKVMPKVEQILLDNCFVSYAILYRTAIKLHTLKLMNCLPIQSEDLVQILSHPTLRTFVIDLYSDNDEILALKNMASTFCNLPPTNSVVDLQILIKDHLLEVLTDESVSAINFACLALLLSIKSLIRVTVPFYSKEIIYSNIDDRTELYFILLESNSLMKNLDLSTFEQLPQIQDLKITTTLSMLEFECLSINLIYNSTLKKLHVKIDETIWENMFSSFMFAVSQHPTLQSLTFGHQFPQTDYYFTEIAPILARTCGGLKELQLYYDWNREDDEDFEQGCFAKNPRPKMITLLRKQLPNLQVIQV